MNVYELLAKLLRSSAVVQMENYFYRFKAQQWVHRQDQLTRTSTWEILKNPFSNNDIKQSIYCRYVDDIFVVVRNEEHLLQLEQQLESSSVLNFTNETIVNGKMPFLDVNIKSDNGQFVSDVYRKSTNDAKLLNARSQCPDKYKSSVIIGAMRRAYKICSSRNLFYNEIENLIIF